MKIDGRWLIALGLAIACASPAGAVSAQDIWTPRSIHVARGDDVAAAVIDLWHECEVFLTRSAKPPGSESFLCGTWSDGDLRFSLRAVESTRSYLPFVVLERSGVSQDGPVIVHLIGGPAVTPMAQIAKREIVFSALLDAGATAVAPGYFGTSLRTIYPAPELQAAEDDVEVMLNLLASSYEGRQIVILAESLGGHIASSALADNPTTPALLLSPVLAGSEAALEYLRTRRSEESRRMNRTIARRYVRTDGRYVFTEYDLIRTFDHLERFFAEKPAGPPDAGRHPCSRIVVGTADELALFQSESLSSAKIVRVPGGTHNLYLSAPEALERISKEFFACVERTTREDVAG